MSDVSSLIDDAISPYVLRNAFVFEQLPAADRTILEQNSIPQTMLRGEVLFRQGAYAKAAFRLYSGKVKIFMEAPSGQHQTLYIYSDGDLVGYRQLLSAERYPMSAELLEDSVIGVIPTDVFLRLVRESPYFSRNLLEAMASEFSVWMNRLTLFAQQPVQGRLILCLLILHQIYTHAGRGTITITRTELAEYVGASLETVVRALAPLITDCLIQVQGRRITLPDPGGLLGHLHL